MRFFTGAMLSFMVLEIISIVLMADWIGGGSTLLLMLTSFIGGLVILRRIGLAGVAEINTVFRQGKNVSPYRMLLPIRYGIAAFLLMSPGFVSDILAALLLFPLKGKQSADEHDTYQNNTGAFRHYSAGQNQEDDIIEGDYTVQNGANANHPVRNLPPERK